MNRRMTRKIFTAAAAVGVSALTTVAMAEELGISPHTIRDHLKHLYRKTGTKGRNELFGLISRDS